MASSRLDRNGSKTLNEDRYRTEGKGKKPPKMSPGAMLRDDVSPKVMKKPAKRSKKNKDMKNSVLFGKKTTHEFTVKKPVTARRKKVQGSFLNTRNYRQGVVKDETFEIVKRNMLESSTEMSKPKRRNSSNKSKEI